MTHLEFLREALSEAEQRRDLHQARALFQKIQRETWRTVPRMPERLPTIEEVMADNAKHLTRNAFLEAENERLRGEVAWLRQVMA